MNMINATADGFIAENFAFKDYEPLMNGGELRGKTLIGLKSFLHNNRVEPKDIVGNLFPHNPQTDYRFLQELLDNQAFDNVTGISQGVLSEMDIEDIESIISCGVMEEEAKAGMGFDFGTCLMYQDQIRIDKHTLNIEHGVTLWYKANEQIKNLLNPILERNEPTRLLKKHLLQEDFFVGIPMIINSMSPDNIERLLTRLDVNNMSDIDYPSTASALKNLPAFDDATIDEVWADYQENCQKYLINMQPCHTILLGRHIDRPVTVMLDVASVVNQQWVGDMPELKNYFAEFCKQIKKESPNASDDVLRKLFLLDFEMLVDSDPLAQLAYITKLGFDYGIDLEYLKGLKANDELIDLVNEERLKQSYRNMSVGGRA